MRFIAPSATGVIVWWRRLPEAVQILNTFGFSLQTYVLSWHSFVRRMGCMMLDYALSKIKHIFSWLISIVKYIAITRHCITIRIC